MQIDIWKHMSDAGDKTFSPKPQYVRGGFIFTCPECNEEISSHSFLNIGSFQIACNNHMGEHNLR